MSTEQSHIENHASQQAPQDIPAALVARQYPIGDEEGAGARVVGHNAKGHVVGVIATVRAPRDLHSGVDRRARGVDLVDVVDPLQNGRHALESESGVDVLGGQFAKDREALLAGSLTAFELHEHEVPHLEIAVFICHRTALTAVFRAAVVIDLAARPTRSRHTHGPEVVHHAPALDPFSGQTDQFLPEPGRLVVVLIHRDPELLLRESVAAL